MDEKPRIVAYKLIIDANIVKHRGRTERQNRMKGKVKGYASIGATKFQKTLAIPYAKS
jgi:hypothetical protein